MIHEPMASAKGKLILGRNNILNLNDQSGLQFRAHGFESCSRLEYLFSFLCMAKGLAMGGSYPRIHVVCRKINNLRINLEVEQAEVTITHENRTSTAEQLQQNLSKKNVEK
jgi:hypothetical protein